MGKINARIVPLSYVHSGATCFMVPVKFGALFPWANRQGRNMTTTMQILLGSALLTTCALIHVGIVSSAIPFLKRTALRIIHEGQTFGRAIVLGISVLVILAAHTVQVWTWAIVFMLSAAISDFPTSFYFSMVTYTSLGYGDLVLGEGMRIFATFAAVTGMLTFGISTAFLISILGALFPDLHGRR